MAGHKKARFLRPGFFVSRGLSVLNRSLGAGFVFTGTGIDFDPVVDVAEIGDLDLGTVAQLGWLHYLAGSVATGGTFGVGDLANDGGRQVNRNQDRKSTRLNSSHSQISYAVFC